MTLVTKSNPVFRNMFQTKSWMPDSLGLMDEFFNNREQNFIPAVNIHESEKAFTLDFKAPGYEKENFKVTLDNDVLTVAAEFSKEENVNEKNYSRKEFVVNSFKRSFTIPETVNSEGMEAKYENGILKVLLPKKEVSLKPAAKEITVL
jgi:HSP20 family protein